MTLPRWIFSVFFLCALLLPSDPFAQGQGSAVEEPSPLSALIQKSLDTIEKDTSLDDSQREALAKRYAEARERVEEGKSFKKEENGAKGILEKGPAELAAMRAEMERRKAGVNPPAASESEDAPADAGPELLDTRLAAERAKVADLGRQLRDKKTEVTALEARPAKLRDRSVALTLIISEAENVMAKWDVISQPSAKELADRTFDQANLAALRAEQAKLEQESLSLTIRRDLARVGAELAASDLELARARVTRLEERRNAIVTARIDETEHSLVELGLLDGDASASEKNLAEEIRALVRTNEMLLAKISSSDVELSRVTAELDRLRREGDNLRAQIHLGGLESSLTEIIFDLRSTLPSSASLRTVVEERRRAISRARLEALRLDRELQTLPSSSVQVEQLLGLLGHRDVKGKELAKIQAEVKKFVASRTKLREDAIDANNRLATILGEIDVITSETLAVSSDLHDFLGERLVWVASSPPLGKNAFTGLRSSILALVGPQVLPEYAEAIRRISWIRWSLAGVLAYALLLPRRRLRRFLSSSAERTRRISTDGILHTIEALIASLWLALPLPVLMWFFGWTFSTDILSTKAVYALGQGLMAPAFLLLALRFSWVLCWQGGVGDAHFQWRKTMLAPMRRALVSLLIVYFPAHAVLAIWWNNGGDLSSFQGPGRLIFILAMISFVAVLRRLFRTGFSKADGGELEANDKEKKGLFHKLRGVWMFILLLLPAVFAILAVLGHFLTAVALAYLLQKTLIVVFGGVLVDSFLKRWAGLKARRMALADALAQREARRLAQKEASEGADEKESISINDEALLPQEEEIVVDWSLVGRQTEQLIRAVVIVFVLLGCWFAWSKALPALKYLDRRELLFAVSFSDLIRLGVIGTVATIVFQNLSSVLEQGLLRVLELDSGARNAIVTLLRYTVIAVATVAVFQVLGLDWARFSWIAAALSVGLGFGLQEVVANFVCGLILLFERPIRLGDIVTVNDVDGVVTKIRIRATTITNWDKKEYIVPNKEFITGTILNWTLSNRMTRLVFPLGIAYGSDVETARSILLEIANQQPEVLSEPAPTAVFENFGPNTLDLSLRCFVGGPEFALEVKHRVNSLIHQRFAAEGIEIPFAQLQVHMTQVDPISSSSDYQIKQK